MHVELLKTLMTQPVNAATDLQAPAVLTTPNAILLTLPGCKGKAPERENDAAATAATAALLATLKHSGGMLLIYLLARRPGIGLQPRIGLFGFEKLTQRVEGCLELWLWDCRGGKTGFEHCLTSAMPSTSQGAVPSTLTEWLRTPSSSAHTLRPEMLLERKLPVRLVVKLKGIELSNCETRLVEEGGWDLGLPCELGTPRL